MIETSFLVVMGKCLLLACDAVSQLSESLGHDLLSALADAVSIQWNSMNLTAFAHNLCDTDLRLQHDDLANDLIDA
jgi:hypothetical protein